MNDEFLDNEMDMPTPCEHCGDVFDLNDGCGSDKWYPNIVICEKCHDEEEKEIEEDERWNGLNIEITNALYELDKEENLLTKLDSENIEMIKKLYALLK
jgi:hypothetical protein